MQNSDGEVIAQLMITYEWSDWRSADIWWIQSVYVHPPYRRQGLFTQLYNHAKAESQKAGACGLRLYADNGNTRAHATVICPSLIVALECALPLWPAALDQGSTLWFYAV
jgi:GNAT superfamily N-acetyltransferase